MIFFLLTFMSWPYLSCWIVPSHLLATPHCPDLSAMCLIRRFLLKVKDLRQSVVSCWMSAISLASIQPVHLLSQRFECWWCFYKPPWVHCSLKHWKGGSSAINLSPSLMGTQRVFLIFISIFDIHAIVSVWNSAMYTPQQTQLSSLKPGFWANLTLKFFLLFLRFSPLWQEWGREGGREEETCPRESLLIFCDVLDYRVCKCAWTEERVRARETHLCVLQNIEVAVYTLKINRS